MTEQEYRDRYLQPVYDDPVDHLEPLEKPFDQLRDARIMTVHLLNDFASEMLEALTNDVILHALHYAGYTQSPMRWVSTSPAT